MTTLLSKFRKNVVGSSDKISDYISEISPSGDYIRNNNLSTILNSWNNILLTPTRTNTYDPEYGCELYKYVFDLLDENTIEEIKNEIMYRLMLYDDRAEIIDIDITPNISEKSINIFILVEYEGEQGEVSAVIDKNTYLKILE